MPKPGRLNIGIVSAGRVGSAMGSALRAAGHAVSGAYAPSPASRERLESMLPGVPAMDPLQVCAASELVLLAVPDDELPPLVAGLAKTGAFRSGQIVLHVAGRYGARVLEPAAASGAMTLAIHPAMTFTGTSLDVARLAGCPFAVTAPGMLLPIGQALVTEIGGVPFVVEEEDRGLYHAALAHASNHLVTLVGQAMRALEAAGIEEPGVFLAPLVEASLDGALRSGDAALTGPVSRGDAGTVRDHLAAFDALAVTGEGGDIPPVYRALAEATARRVDARTLGRGYDLAGMLAALGPGAGGLPPGTGESSAVGPEVADAADDAEVDEAAADAGAAVGADEAADVNEADADVDVAGLDAAEVDAAGADPGIDPDWPE